MNSCYDDYINDFDYDGVYFPYQINTRTFVVGEGMKIEVGVVLGGVRENNHTREVKFLLDSSLITSSILSTMQSSGFSYIKESVTDVTSLSLMPNDYFRLSNSSTIFIEKGKHVGTVIVQPDSVNFLNDPATLKAKYVLPFQIVEADADTILQNKNYAIIGLKYENMLFGNYWHGGVTIVKDSFGNEIPSRRTAYYTAIPAPEATVWKLTTVKPFELETNGISGLTGDQNSIKLTLNADGTISVGKSSKSNISVEGDGPCFFNKAKLLQNRKIILSYKYPNSDGTTSYASDTLTFRNRIRDGVNEWQDENPANYN